MCFGMNLGAHNVTSRIKHCRADTPIEAALAYRRYRAPTGQCQHGITDFQVFHRHKASVGQSYRLVLFAAQNVDFSALVLEAVLFVLAVAEKYLGAVLKRDVTLLLVERNVALDHPVGEQGAEA